ncbi:HEPN domain-containing protein [Aliirhizobium smilacinae]|uniref:HEPN domain-containing protein n=1 Tax=Aliirhizobium smilacinae TaxID=1395944 RepID=A0A5C4XPG9_9HYPH|nr:HEPN domain-containing protein [Rhizobium smilacinae]TNM65332.1 HEPN domain-containing protein [Rhizobium smilacinae]
MASTAEHFDEVLDHLPPKKRRELARAVKIIFDEFDAAQQFKTSEKKRAGRILKVILFGSYARGDWVEDRKSGYRSDYDILVVVNIHSVSEENDLWQSVSEHFLRELMITKAIQTPVNVIVHTLHDTNDQLARGKPFFVDLLRDGITLFEESGHPLVGPKPLTASDVRIEARAYFDQWFPNALEFERGAEFYTERSNHNLAAFSLHQAAERFYHCTLLVCTLYSPKSHRLRVLRSAAERVEPRLIEAWPRDTKLARRSFEQLDRAYVEARYSPSYSITVDELRWLFERVRLLEALVRDVCEEHLRPPNAELLK